jgi:hypothetical protein
MPSLVEVVERNTVDSVQSSVLDWVKAMPRGSKGGAKSATPITRDLVNMKGYHLKW